MKEAGQEIRKQKTDEQLIDEEISLTQEGE